MREGTEESKRLMFGDYSVTKARGRWTAECYHCHRYRPRSHWAPGYAESAVRAHLRDAHHLARIRRDGRETWLR